MGWTRSACGALLLVSACSFHVNGVTIDAAPIEDMSEAPDLAMPGPVQLAFAQTQPMVAAGTCSGALTVETRDAGGTAFDVVADTVIALAVAPAGGLKLYTDDQCATEATSITIAAGTHGADFHVRGTAAATVMITASSAGLSDATTMVAVTPGAPAALAFTNAPLTVDAGTCSGAVTVEVRDAFGTASPVAAATALTLAASPSAGFTFYSDAACSTIATGATVTAGATSATVRFKATFPGPTGLTASATGLTSAMQTEIVQAGPAATLTIATAAQTLTTNSCSSVVTVQARDAAGNDARPSTIALSAAPPGGVTFYSDANCTMPITSLDTTGGLVSVYFRRSSTGTFTLSASATGTSGATQNENIAADAVQTGTCSIADGQTSGTCTIAPALVRKDKTFFVFQATSAGASTPANSDVRCSLTDTSTITCDRNGTTGAISIRWYTVFVPNGMTVQHLQPACTGTTTDVTITSVDPAHTFLLYSSLRDGSDISNDDVRSVALTSATNVEIQFVAAGGMCSMVAQSLQVVQYALANVTRGTSAIAATAASASVTGLSAVDRTRAFLLYTYRDPDDNHLCNRMVRGALATDTSIAFSRGNGDSANCYADNVAEIDWERVELPSGTLVQSVNPTVADTVDTATVAISAVDATRTFAFAGGQWTNGQSIGESVDVTQQIGAMTGLHRLASSTSLEVKRGQASGAAQWTSFVVQLR
jgi:hypothetical protein